MNLEFFGLGEAPVSEGSGLDYTVTASGGSVGGSCPVFRESRGSDRDFDLLTLSGTYFRPLSPTLYFGTRGAGRPSGSGPNSVLPHRLFSVTSALCPS